MPELSDAIYYESRFFSNSVRIPTYTYIDAEYITKTGVLVKRMKRKYTRVKKNKVVAEKVWKLPENVDTDATLSSDSESSSET